MRLDGVCDCGAFLQRRHSGINVIFVLSFSVLLFVCSLFPSLSLHFPIASIPPHHRTYTSNEQIVFFIFPLTEFSHCCCFCWCCCCCWCDGFSSSFCFGLIFLYCLLTSVSFYFICADFFHCALYSSLLFSLRLRISFVAHFTFHWRWKRWCSFEPSNLSVYLILMCDRVKAKVAYS